ncbi:hypothetical protein SASPL_131709 [Salvia splendens]|uniref:Uncharacterized protein n=1 Tax=Salvia splendens TaxID=180675 RepID=A0A8X8X6D7_SALSN|nr:hypothetical protein SASPL_131709 [Salvia splendens]
MTIEISIHNLFFMILRTEMYEVKDNEFPPMVFSFKPFDIIGVITSPRSVVKQSRYGLIEVEISDEQIKHDDTFLEQGIVDQTGVRVSREFDDLDVKSLGDVVCLETCVKKVRVLDDKKFRFRFVVNIVDDSSNASLLLNSKECYRRYPYTVNKSCNIPKVVEKFVPENIASQVLNTDVKLVDLPFGSDIVEVSGKGFVTPDLSVVTKQNEIEWIAEESVK